MTDVIVIGAGPAGLVAALRAGDLGASTTLITSDEFGGMASNDGPVPVRTLAHAARLIREARQLSQYGISSTPPSSTIHVFCSAFAMSSKTFAAMLLSARS